MPANLKNAAVATGLEKVSYHSNLKERQRRAKNAQTTAQLHSSHMQVMFKILQARLQQYMNHELPDVQAGFRKGIVPTSAGSWKKQETSRKTSISALLTMPKPLTVWITIKCGKF